jgi:hypothetical protein
MWHLITEMFAEIIIDAVNMQFPFITNCDHLGSIGSNGKIKHAVEAPLMDNCTEEIPYNDLFINAGRDEVLAVGKPSTHCNNFIMLHGSNASSILTSAQTDSGLTSVVHILTL